MGLISGILWGMVSNIKISKKIIVKNELNPIQKLP